MVESGQVYELAKENPELQVEIVKRPGHPYITATYSNNLQFDLHVFLENGRTLIHDCKNKDQDALALKVLHIRSTWGNKGRKFGNGKVGAEVRSVQGGWNPLLWQYSQAQQRDLLSLQVKE